MPKIGKGGIAEALQSVRESIARLAADQHTVESAAHPSSDVKLRMVAQIEALAERGAPNVSNAIEAGLDIRFATIDIRSPLTGFVSSTGMPQLSGWASHSAPDALALIGWLFKGQLIDALSDEIDALADDENALDDAARATKLEELRRAQLQSERLEERLIEIAAEEGRTIARRPSADPRAVLGLHSSMPAPRQ